MSDGYCHYTPDNGYAAPCGEPATYRVWGDPCSCMAVMDRPTCHGHLICERHALTVRGEQVPVAHSSMEAHATAFVPVRMRSLVAS